VVPHQRHHARAERLRRRSHREALQAAKQAGLTVSYDLNYRGKLWSPEKAQAVQEPLMPFVDVLITTEEDTSVVFKIKSGGKTEAKEFTMVSAETLQRCGPKTSGEVPIQSRGHHLARESAVWRNTWSALAYADGKFYEDVKYELEIVDRLGEAMLQRGLYLRTPGEAIL